MNKIFLFLIILITFFVWGPIINQVPTGEGYYYFDTAQRFTYPILHPISVKQFDNFARIAFQIATPILGDRIELYMLLQFILMIFLYLTMYKILEKITNNKGYAFFTTVLFLSNYTGSFSMIGTGNYQRFIQRIPNLIPLFISFYFLTKYLNTKQIKHLLISLTTYILSFYLAHHSIFSLPLFVCYILVKTLSKKINIKSFLINLLIILFLVVSSKFLSTSDHFVPKQGIISYLTNTPAIIDKILLQIPNLLVPTEVTRYIAKNWPILPIPYPFSFVLKIFLFPILLIFISVLVLSNGETNKKVLLKSAIIALPLVCFLNLYAYGDGAPHPLRDFGEDRIYFIPSIYNSIIVGYFLTYLWSSNKRFLKILSIAGFVSLLIYNKLLINRDLLKYNTAVNEMKNFISYVKNKSQDRNLKIAIIGPSHLLWPTQFLNLYYNTNNNLYFYLDSSTWKVQIKDLNLDSVFLLDYTNEKIVETQMK